jgi:hypothetical protein
MRAHVYCCSGLVKCQLHRLRFLAVNGLDLLSTHYIHMHTVQAFSHIKPSERLSCALRPPLLISSRHPRAPRWTSSPIAAPQACLEPLSAAPPISLGPLFKFPILPASLKQPSRGPESPTCRSSVSVAVNVDGLSNIPFRIRILATDHKSRSFASPNWHASIPVTTECNPLGCHVRARV